MKNITRDPEVYLWNKEFDCHTDKIRERWIESYQQAYCKKNPDEKSCRIKPQDLCDYYKVMNLPKTERYLLKVNRICERLLNLPQKVKDWWPEEVAFCRLRDDL